MRHLRRRSSCRRRAPRGRTAASLTIARRAALVVVGAALALSAFAAEPPRPGPDDRCAVCGMFVSRYPSWVAAVVLEEGRTVFFDGPKDMFRFLLDPERFGFEADADDDDEPRSIWVTDYYTTRMIDARQAFFVVGSDVVGPMGAELVPLATREQADGFLADHGGERILEFQEVRPETVPR